MNSTQFLISNFSGELAALAASFLWAAASILYSRIGRQITPVRMNLLKNVLAAGMLIITLWFGGGLFYGVDSFALLLLLISGAVGIGLGDTAYFHALKTIGPRRSLLVMILSPPITGVIALVFLDEQLSSGAWAGIFLTVIGVSWVISERVSGSGFDSQNILRGIYFGFLAALAQAVAAILSHAVFLHTNLSPMRSAFLRVIGGILIGAVWMPVVKSTEDTHFRPAHSIRLWLKIGFAVFIGTYLALWLQQVSLKFAAAGIAQTLFATSPLFVIPFALWMGEKVSVRAILGSVLAIIGVSFLFGLQ
jgi:drug/metabolite transporter (DMT)-like permease